ncbi:Transposase (fragment) [Zobellia galactanivorans]|uniref:Transposase n=1 Tax=Zobellia galactanivorans (strain DSM 12802 / CCUG 47099 / CIP 106680 / NCIMB 13871 / Dsij) TaxID=63186 RepID=G0L777_ZOBGA
MPNKYIFENLDQVRERTQIWMNDYNHHRPHMPWVKYRP